jgi:hypothetical protein
MSTQGQHIQHIRLRYKYNTTTKVVAHNVCATTTQTCWCQLEHRLPAHTMQSSIPPVSRAHTRQSGIPSVSSRAAHTVPSSIPQPSSAKQHSTAFHHTHRVKRGDQQHKLLSVTVSQPSSTHCAEPHSTTFATHCAKQHSTTFQHTHRVKRGE